MPDPIAPDKADDAYDTMASVFDDLMVSDPASTTEGEPSTPPVDPAATPPVAETPPVVEPPAAEPPAAEPPAVEPPAVEPPEEIDWKSRYDALEAERAPTPQPPVVEPPAAATPPEPLPEMYAPEEKEFLVKYAEEWPDIVRGEALRRRAEYNTLVDHIFTQFAQTYGPLIDRGVRAADAFAETSSLQVVQAAHADYDGAMYDQVVDWANGLTGTRQRIAKEIIEHGEPQEVVDLITEYKSASGIKPRVVAVVAPATAAAPAKTGLSAKAKQAAQAMGVVDSKRSTLAPTADPTDFDSAWDDAMGSK